MANDQISTYTGITGNTHTHRVIAMDATVWNGAALEAYQTANIVTYAITATEQGTASGRFVSTFPAGLAAGLYWVELVLGDGSAESQPVLDRQLYEWDGSEITSVGFSATLFNKIADHVLRRAIVSAEGSDDGDATRLGSLYGFIQQAQNSNTTENAGELTVNKTDDTELGRLTLDSGTADPIKGVTPS